ncbi:hypothetical protein QJQ45_003892 [Haematococcus lacustris]|nr:hypothetical protein QJQ45_003892 [Haematococcus lacustris]
MAVDPAKVKVVREWHVPRNLKDLQAFLGLANYFRRFIPNFSSLAAPLTNLTSKQVAAAYDWEHFGGSELEAFDGLKEALCSAPVLALPDFSKPFVVCTDASLVGTGGVLMQDGRPIAYTSKKMPPAEMRYATGEQELLGIIRAVREWSRNPALANEVALTSSSSPHNADSEDAMTVIMTLSSRAEGLIYAIATRRTAARLRESAELGQVAAREAAQRAGQLAPPDDLAAAHTPGQARMTSAHRKGAQPGGGEALRQQQQTTESQNKSNKQGGDAQSTIESGPLTLMQAIKEAYAADKRFADEAFTSQLYQHEGLWLTEWGRVVVPDDAALRKRSYVRSCHSCQVNKSSAKKPAGLLQPLPIPERPWDSVSMDLIVKLPASGPNKYDSILVFVDILTKMVHLVMTWESMSATQYAKLFLEHVFQLHGMSRSVVSDRGPQSHNRIWVEVTKLLQVQVNLSSAYHPETDGQTERVNRVIEEMLRHFIRPDQLDWAEYLPLVEFAINNAWQESVRSTPFNLSYGYHPRLAELLDLPQKVPQAHDFVKGMKTAVEQARQCLARAQKRMKSYQDNKRREVLYLPGDMVLLSTQNMRGKADQPGVRKLKPRYVGPFSVQYMVGKAAVKLWLPDEWSRLHNVFHVSLVKPYRTDASGAVPGLAGPPPVQWLDGEPQYTVEKVVGHRLEPSKGKRKGKRHGDEHDTWELSTQLVGCQELMARYMAEHNMGAEAEEPADGQSAKGVILLHGPLILGQPQRPAQVPLHRVEHTERQALWDQQSRLQVGQRGTKRQLDTAAPSAEATAPPAKARPSLFGSAWPKITMSRRAKAKNTNKALKALAERLPMADARTEAEEQQPMKDRPASRLRSRPEVPKEPELVYKNPGYRKPKQKIFMPDQVVEFQQYVLTHGYGIIELRREYVAGELEVWAMVTLKDHGAVIFEKSKVDAQGELVREGDSYVGTDFGTGQRLQLYFTTANEDGTLPDDVTMAALNDPFSWGLFNKLSDEDKTRHLLAIEVTKKYLTKLQACAQQLSPCPLRGGTILANDYLNSRVVTPGGFKLNPKGPTGLVRPQALHVDVSPKEIATPWVPTVTQPLPLAPTATSPTAALEALASAAAAAAVSPAGVATPPTVPISGASAHADCLIPAMAAAAPKPAAAAAAAATAAPVEAAAAAAVAVAAAAAASAAAAPEEAPAAAGAAAAGAAAAAAAAAATAAGAAAAAAGIPHPPSFAAATSVAEGAACAPRPTAAAPRGPTLTPDPAGTSSGQAPPHASTPGFKVFGREGMVLIIAMQLVSILLIPGSHELVKLSAPFWNAVIPDDDGHVNEALLPALEEKLSTLTVLEVIEVELQPGQALGMTGVTIHAGAEGRPGTASARAHFYGSVCFVENTTTLVRQMGKIIDGAAMPTTEADFKNKDKWPIWKTEAGGSMVPPEPYEPVAQLETDRLWQDRFNGPLDDIKKRQVQLIAAWKAAVEARAAKLKRQKAAEARAAKAAKAAEKLAQGGAATAVPAAAVKGGPAAVVTSSSTVAITSSAVAITSRAVDIGTSAVVVSSGAVVISFSAVVISSSAVGIGDSAVTISSSAVEISYSAVAITSSAVAIGSIAVVISSSAVANGSSAVVISSSAVAIGSIAVVISSSAVANGSSAVAISSSAVAIGSIAVVISSSAVVNGSSAVVISSSAVANGSSAVAIGSSAVAKSSSAVVISSRAVAIGSLAVAIGSRAVAIGSRAVAIGSRAVAIGSRAVAIGSRAETTGSRAETASSRAETTGSRAETIGSSAGDAANLCE